MALIRILFIGTAVSTLALCGAVSAQQPGGQQFGNTSQQNSNQGGQQQQISPGEVRSYFRQVENQINQAVQSGNPQSLHQWTQNNIADSANFQAVIEIGGQNSVGAGPKEIRVLSLSKNDMLRRQRAAFSLAPEILNMVENYDLGIRVQNVHPIGNDAAVVKTRISETGTIGNASGRQFGANSGMETQGMGPQQGQSQGRNEQSQAQNQDAQGGPWGARGFRQRTGQTSGQGQGQGVSFDAEAECTQLVQRDPNSGRLTIGLSNCTGEMQF